MDFLQLISTKRMWNSFILYEIKQLSVDRLDQVKVKLQKVYTVQLWPKDKLLLHIITLSTINMFFGYK